MTDTATDPGGTPPMTETTETRPALDLDAIEARERQAWWERGDSNDDKERLRDSVNDVRPLVAKVREMQAELHRLRPAPCNMTHTPPMDFAQCETHDEAFPLGSTCRFHGREHEPELVYAEEAHEQRVRAVAAEAEVARLRAEVETSRIDPGDYLNSDAWSDACRGSGLFDRASHDECDDPDCPCPHHAEIGVQAEVIGEGQEVAAALTASLHAAEAERDDLRGLFDLQQTRMGEATDAWRAEAPEERAHKLPDLGVLLTWLLDRAGLAEAERDAAREALEAATEAGRMFGTAFIHRDPGTGRETALDPVNVRVVTPLTPVDMRKRAERAEAGQERLRKEAEGYRDGYRAAMSELERAAAVLRDVALNGLRVDLTPTVETSDPGRMYTQLVGLLRSCDQAVRERARKTLAGAEGSDTE